MLAECWPKIKQAAIKDGKGEVHTLPRPNRHNDIIHTMRDNDIEEGPGETQGFITVGDMFVSRKIAAITAVNSGQIKKLKRPPYLYSEDLW